MKDFSRFIFEGRHFSKERNRVKPTAFIPWSDSEASVAKIESLDENSIWQLGDDIGKLNRGKSSIARGDFNDSEVQAARLALKIAEPPPRHWHLIGWDISSKEKQILQAQELAPLAELHVR